MPRDTTHYTEAALRLANELGEEFAIPWDVASDEQLEETVDAAIADAEERLPAGVVYEIRGKSVPTGALGDYGRVLNGESDADRLRRRTANWGVAWYWTSAEPRRRFYGGLPQTPLFRKPVRHAEENLLGGYLVIARLRSGHAPL